MGTKSQDIQKIDGRGEKIWYTKQAHFLFVKETDSHMRILVLAGQTYTLLYRKELLGGMVAMGHEVIACAPEEDEDGGVAAFGGTFVRLAFERGQTNPLSNLELLNQYRKLVKRIRPDMVFCFSLKPNLYGPIAARAVTRRIYTLFAGLGNVFTEGGGLRRAMIRALVKPMLCISLQFCEAVIFQNPDDESQFIRDRLVKKRKAYLVNGSGVDMAYFRPVPLPEQPAFIMVSRLLREKGIMEYLEAARLVKKHYPMCTILLVGPYEGHSNALKPRDLEPYLQDGSIEYIGEVKDVRPYYERASVVVLPSYREGAPRTIIEGMACKRAVIATNAPGCRETVIDGVTGLLIPTGDAGALAEAMQWMIEHPDAVRRMGEAGYAYCQERYEVSKVNAEMCRIMKLIDRGR